MPLGVKEVDAPHGISRLIASQAAHATDFARLHIFDEEESTLSREAFIASTKIYVAECGAKGAAWDDIEAELTAGFASAGIELDLPERLEIYEVWDAAYPWTERAA